jgi:ribosomal protein L11 methyltransferase
MRLYPALDVSSPDCDTLLALTDDFQPIAVEERDGTTRIFFGSAADRDAAHVALSPQFTSAPVDVSDEDWARRSQEGLPAITVGRVTVVASRQSSVLSPESPVSSPESPAPSPSGITIVIPPSMGFGTGHHVTTRLCLQALQDLDLAGKTVLDVGTGSGVLAIAADLLGAARARGIDYDADAVQAARENLPLNPSARRVTFDIVDVNGASFEPADIVTANLTGALLVKSATTVLHSVKPGGTLILSGILAAERDEVAGAMAPAAVVWEREAEGWVGLAMKK